MPYSIKKEKCKKSDGGSGTHRLRYTDKKGKKHSSCHTSKKSAQGSIAAIEMRRETDHHAEGELQMEMLVRRLIRETILREELTPADKREIEKLARRQAQIEIERVVGPDFTKTVREEVTKAIGSKATKEEIAEVAEAVLKRLHRELATTKK